MEDTQTNPNPPAEPPADETQAVSEVEQLKAQAADNLSGWQRANADYANLKRESAKIREELIKYACVGFIEKMLPVYDALAKAMAQKPAVTDAAKQWVDGVGHIKSQLDKIFTDEKITPIDQVDVMFDPVMHEAMMNQAKEGVEPGTVIQILEQGYKLHDKVVRPAKVVVSE